jgi:hypothetical protein
MLACESMPLTEKGKEIESAMKKEYGPEKGEQVLYASKNAGTISGIDGRTPPEKVAPRNAFTVLEGQ